MGNDWSIAVKSVLSLLLVAIGTWILCPAPGPRMTAEFKKLVRFGSGVTGFGVADTASHGLDRVALGYFYGPGPVGYYQNAFLLYSNALTVLTSSLHNVAISGLSKSARQSGRAQAFLVHGLVSRRICVSARIRGARDDRKRRRCASLRSEMGRYWSLAFCIRAQGNCAGGRTDAWLASCGRGPIRSLVALGVVSTLFQLAVCLSGRWASRCVCGGDVRAIRPRTGLRRTAAGDNEQRRFSSDRSLYGCCNHDGHPGKPRFVMAVLRGCPARALSGCIDCLLCNLSVHCRHSFSNPQACRSDSVDRQRIDIEVLRFKLALAQSGLDHGLVWRSWTDRAA